jgi:hypothetical protein
MTTQRRRSCIDWVSTFKVYRARISHLPEDVFLSLHGRYLSTFDIYGTILVNNKAIELPVMCTAKMIMDEALRRDVGVLGVTSERTHRGMYIDVTRGSLKTEDIVYVGQFNHFTHHAASVWTLLPSDKVLVYT